MTSLKERLKKLEDTIQAPSFRGNTGKANEVSYWVFDYAPEKELEVREEIAYLKNKNTKGINGFELVVFDLYDLIMDHLAHKNFIEKCITFEKEKSLAYVASAVRNSLKITDNDNLIVEYITKHTPKDAVVFLIGIGKCFPLLQAPEVFNKVLYNMPQAFAGVPMILFYPGTYTEQELLIFNKLKEDNYYRAFRIVR